ncbi:hypothetical protein J4Q44_G00037270, partial [Coregonus suidteri]
AVIGAFRLPQLRRHGGTSLDLVTLEGKREQRRTRTLKSCYFYSSSRQMTHTLSLSAPTTVSC